MSQSKRSALTCRIARYIGLRTFRGHRHRRTLLHDCESVAWELERTAPPHVTAASIAYKAVKRVTIGRQFKESIRSITTGRCDKRAKRPENLQQVHVELNDIAALGTPPSESVPGWMDYMTWLSRYDARKRSIAEALAIGGKTGEVACEYGVSAARIAQMRREFERDWTKFQSAT